MSGSDDPEAVDGASELERTIGLPGAITIGVGTMIGAGIFVFPGLAAGRAGPAATVSFAIGAGVALLVALPTAELATAMPESGGGYYFVSRGLGGVFGGTVGVSLTFGLVFAAAFYLVGFGEYAVAALAEAGLRVAIPAAIGPLSDVYALAIGAGLALTALGIVGTENAESLQNALVGLLVAILLVVLARSALDVFGLLGGSRVPEEFVPYGYGAVFSTAALVFTSYLGFAQIATVAGEIVEPDRTLPVALVGSVLFVGALYVVTVFVAASTFEPAALVELGETATAEIARAYLGPVGAIAALVAGFLATLSSANASLLSGSRTVHALSRDGLAPERTARVSQRYGTPHFALSLVGGLAVALVVVGPIETLAEVASFLHLLMYGLMCVTQIRLRRSDPAWYEPTFRCPATPWVSIGGAVASAGLLAFMQPLSQVVGLAVTGFGTAWYYVYGSPPEM
ncbi:APC family permease [Halorussus marinus]|uniref:APC family permease n=1 Tax=Halorussus marinus TaxID=2505976 RepID=UPI0010921C32|nr:amino acid permease [Halorussus marinus]